jgi:serine/threonine-protein kinase HipA
MVAKTCEVKFDGTTVGALALQEQQPVAVFEYTPEWLAEGFSLSPLHLPLRKGSFAFPNLSYDTYKGLPAVFADSLPDDFGNALINAWLARKGFDSANFTALDRLLYTGKRGMGALEYEPASTTIGAAAFEVNLADLVHLAQSVLNERENFAASIAEANAMSHLIQIGTSAGGARPKAVIAINADRTMILSGQVDAPTGFEHYLLKFDGIEQHNHQEQTFGDPKGFGVMEYVYYKMASACEIDMQPCELLSEGKRRHFMTKRFDRYQNQKYHTLTLCGMAHADFKKPGHYSYEELLGVARALNLNYKEQVQIFRRMVFNVIACNHDDHTKNTSFFVDDEFQWALAPAYDIAWSYKKESPWVNQHQMSINGKRDYFVRDDLLSVAKLITNLSTKKANDIIEQTIAVVSLWPQMAQDAGVFDGLIESATRTHRVNF